MIRWLTSRVFWGLALVIGGIAMLLQSMGVFGKAGDLFWGAIFLVAGVGFITVYLEDRDRWWAFIPAFTFFGLGFSSLLDVFLPGVRWDLGGFAFLVGISLGFLAVFLVTRQQWWAIIPGGVLATLAIVSLLDSGNLGIDTGGIFFLGIGLTFALLGLLPGYENMLRWAFIPAGILILMGLLLTASSSDWINLIFPAVLILIGVFMVGRVLLTKRG
jgi:hypothetical protein